MAITARSENRCSGIVDLEQVLIHFISKNDRSASALVIRMVQAVTGRRWIFGKAFSSEAPSASKRLFGSSLSVDCQSVFHLRTSFPWDLGNGMSFSQNCMPSTSSSRCSALFTIIDGIDRADGERGYLRQKRSCTWMIKESRRGIATVFLG